MKPSDTNKPKQEPLDLLSAVSAELSVMAEEFSLRLKALGKRVEDVALAVEAQREADAATMNKVNQLRTLLTEMAS